MEKANKTVEAMVLYAKDRWGNLPDLEWATRKDTLAFQIDFVRRNSKPMARELLDEKKVIELIQNPNLAPKRLINKSSFTEEIAFKSLKMAFDTLKQLRVI